MNQSVANPIDQLHPFVVSEELALSATEINGFITGMVCGGLQWEDEDCRMNLQQIINQGDALNVEVIALLASIFSATRAQLDKGLLELKLAIEDDSQELSQRLKSIAVWSEGWLLGFGLGIDSGKVSKDALEILADIKNISEVEFEIEDEENDELEKAYVEILEHLKVSIEMLFLEKQQSLLNKPKPQTSENIH